MQILIIKLPAGEQISSLSYTIASGEALIGQESSCQIQLPDQRQKVSSRHARLYQEGNQWYLECLGDHELTLNQTTVSCQHNPRVLLSDGDLITCGDYQLVVSQFEPWQNTHKMSAKPPPLPSADDLAPEFCVIPDRQEIQAGGSIDDPFDHPAVAIKEIADYQEDFTDLSMAAPEQPASLTAGNSLIDVLAPQPDIDNDWSIHRSLWSGDPDATMSAPESLPVCPIPVLSDRVPAPGQHRRSICHAMLEALEQTLEDLSPENLEARFSDQSTGRIRRYFRNKKQPSESSDFRQQYRHFHQHLMADQSYRLLFLQRFRAAMKKQESF